MKCPIDETLMIDYLEGCCEPGAAAQVRSHLEQCPACRREYEELAGVRRMMAGPAAGPPDEPPESFWAENARVVAEATYLQPARLERRWALRLPRAAMTGTLAAAAVLLLTLTWLFESGPFSPGPETLPAVVSLEDTPSAGQALQDSLWMLWREMQEFEMAAKALESAYALQLESDSGAAGGELLYPSDYTVYDGLQDLNDEQVDQVIFLAAGY